MTKKQHTIVLIRNYWDVFWGSLLWLAVLVAMIGVGVYLESSAMQWVMVILWAISLVAEAYQRTEKSKMTLDDALAKLNELKAEE
jgi:cobalamin biosynthesis protein CobD/CbiB